MSVDVFEGADVMTAGEREFYDFIYLAGMSDLYRAACIVLRYETDGWRFGLCSDVRFVEVTSPSGNLYTADEEACACPAGLRKVPCKHIEFLRRAGGVQWVQEVLRRRR